MQFGKYTPDRRFEEKPLVGYNMEVSDIRILAEILENPPPASRAFFPQIVPELVRANARAQVFWSFAGQKRKASKGIKESISEGRNILLSGPGSVGTSAIAREATPIALISSLRAASRKPILEVKDLLVPLQAINQAIEHSPQPTQDWAYASQLFEADFLSQVLNISPASLRRYQADERTTPDGIAERLHWLTLRAIDLSGSYSPPGARRWFYRKREKLSGAAPIDILKKKWNTDDPKIKQISDLARSLTEL